LLYLNAVDVNIELNNDLGKAYEETLKSAVV